MPCEYYGNVIVCYNKAYRYKGYYFEWHRYGGPSPLKKNGDVRLNYPKGFWDMIEEFVKLSEEDKEKYRVN